MSRRPSRNSVGTIITPGEAAIGIIGIIPAGIIPAGIIIGLAGCIGIIMLPGATAMPPGEGRKKNGKVHCP